MENIVPNLCDIDVNKYNRIIDMTKLCTNDPNIILASMVYPIDDTPISKYGYNNTISLLQEHSIDPGPILDIIKNKKSLLYQIIKADQTNPEALYDHAKFLLTKGIPLYKYRNTYIKSRSSIKSLCVKQNKYNSFITYIYYQALFITVNTNNKSLLNILENNKNHMIELCLLFGNKETLTLEDIENWVGKNFLKTNK